MPSLYPQSDQELHFEALVGDPIVFKVIERPESRAIGTSYELVYDVFMDPPRDELLADYIDHKNLADEVIIGWNVFNIVGWTFFDTALVKQWPPQCVRIRHNEYKVTITFAPLSIPNIQMTPVKAKKLFGLETWGAKWNGEAYVPFTLPVGSTGLERTAFCGINVDTEKDSSAVGKIQGLDIDEPSFSWNERWIWGPYNYLRGDSGQDYFGLMTMLTSTINESRFRGMNPGTVLFRGGTSRQIQPLTWEIDYRFSYRPIRRTQKLGPTSLPWFNVPGWHHFDVVSSPKEVEIGSGKYVIQIPELIKLHQVFPFRDFNLLKIYGSDVELNWARFLQSGRKTKPPRLRGLAECKVQATEYQIG